MTFNNTLFPLLCAVCLLFLWADTASAQDFVGFNTHPYAGVSAVDINPASLGGTVYKADVTLGGISLVDRKSVV